MKWIGGWRVEGERWQKIKSLLPHIFCFPQPATRSIIILLLIALFTSAQAQAESRILKIIEAERLELRSENDEELVILTGSPVRLERGEEKIEAERVLYNKTRKAIKLLGNVYYLDKDKQEVRADELDLDTADDSFEALEVRLKSGDFDLIGPICQRAAGQILLEQGYFTSCLQCGHNVADYAFRAKEVLLYPGDRIIAREVQVLIRDQPVLYLPVLLLFLSERRPKLDVGFNSDGPDGAFIVADLPFVSDFGIGFSLLRYWERRGWGFGMDLQGAGPAKERYYFEYLPPTVADRAATPSRTTGYLKYDFSYLLEDEEWKIDAYVRRNDLPSNTNTVAEPQQVRDRLVTDINFKIDYKLGEPIYRLKLDTFLDHNPTRTTPLTSLQRKPELEVDFKEGYKGGGFTVTGGIVAGFYEGSKNFSNSAALANPGSTMRAGRLLLRHSETFTYNSSTAGAVSVALPQGSQLKPLPKFTDSPRYTPSATDKIVLNSFFDESRIASSGGENTNTSGSEQTAKQPQIILTLLNGTLSLPPGVPLAVEAERLEVDFSRGGDLKLGELTFLPGSPFEAPPGSAETLPEGSFTVPPGSTLNLPEGSKVAVSYTLATLPLREGSVLDIPAGTVFTSLTNPTPRTLGTPIKLTVPSGSEIRPGEGTPQTSTISSTQTAQTQPGQAAQTQPAGTAQTQPGQTAQTQPGQAAQTRNPKREIPLTFAYTPEPGSTLQLPEGANLTIPPIPPRPVWEGFTLNVNNRFAGYYYTFRAQRQIEWITGLNATQLLGPFTIGLNFNRSVIEGQNPFGNLDNLFVRPTALYLDYNLGFKPDAALSATAASGYEYKYGRTASDTGWRIKPLNLALAVQPDPVFSINASLTHNIDLKGGLAMPFEPLRFGISFTPSPLNASYTFERDLQNRVPIKNLLNLTLNPVPFSLSFNTSYVWNKLNKITNSLPTYDPVNRFEITSVGLGYNPLGSTLSLNHLRDLNNGQAISTQLTLTTRDEQNTYSISQNLSQPYFGELSSKSNRFRLNGSAFANLGPQNIEFRNDITFPEPTAPSTPFNPENGSADFSLRYGLNLPGNSTTVSLNWKSNFIQNCFLPNQRPFLGITSKIVDVDANLDIGLFYRFGGCELVQRNGQYEPQIQPDYLERAAFVGGFTILPSPRTLDDLPGLSVQGELGIERRNQDGRFEIKMKDLGPTLSFLAPENTRIHFSTFFNAPINNTQLILPAPDNPTFSFKPKFILAIDRCCWSSRITWDMVKGEFKWTVLLGDQAADFLWDSKGFQFPSPTQP